MRLNKRSIALALLIFLAGCSRSVPPAEVVFEKPPIAYHIVRIGESIVSIASNYGMDKNELTRLNGLKPPYRLVVGQRLLVMQQGAVQGHAAVSGYGEGEVIKAQTLEPPQEIGAAAPEMPAVSKGTIIGDEDQPAEAEGSDDAAKPIPASSGQMEWPIQGKIIKNFSSTGGKRGNDGINIAAPKGSSVKAADNGTVARSGNQLRGFGNFVLIKHADDLMTVYTHLDSIAVKDGDTVQRGQVIGTVGVTGQVKEPQIHFEVRRGKTPIDPQPLLQ